MFKRKTKLSGHAGLVSALATDNSGKVLVSAGDDLAICIWYPATWTSRHVIRDADPDAHQGIMILDVSACGKYLATGTADLTTKVYSTETGERIARLHPVVRERYNSAEQICFSQQGDYVVCAKGKTIDYFSIGEFSKKGDLKGHTSKVHLLALSPDGKTLVSCGGKQIKLWDMTTFTERMTLTRHTKLLGSLGVAPNGKFFATGGEDAQIYLWSLPDGQEIGHYAGHEGYVFDVVISPDGQVVASWDFSGQLHLWNAQTCEPIARFDVKRGSPAFVPDSSLLVCFSEKSDSLVLDQQSGQEVQRLPAATHGAVAPDGSWVACSQGNDVVIWSKAD